METKQRHKRKLRGKLNLRGNANSSLAKDQFDASEMRTTLFTLVASNTPRTHGLPA